MANRGAMNAPVAATAIVIAVDLAVKVTVRRAWVANRLSVNLPHRCRLPRPKHGRSAQAAPSCLL